MRGAERGTSPHFTNVRCAKYFEKQPPKDGWLSQMRWITRQMEIHHDMLTTLSTKTVARAWSANEDTTFGSSATERTFLSCTRATKHYARHQSASSSLLFNLSYPFSLLSARSPYPLTVPAQWTHPFPMPLAAIPPVGQNDQLRPETPWQARIDLYSPFPPSPPQFPPSLRGLLPLPLMTTTALPRYPGQNAVGASPARYHVLRANLCAAKITLASKRPGAPK